MPNQDQDIDNQVDDMIEKKYSKVRITMHHYISHGGGYFARAYDHQGTYLGGEIGESPEGAEEKLRDSLRETFLYEKTINLPQDDIKN